MSNIISATISVIGTRPLLQHRFGPEAIPLEKQERTGVAGNDPEEWKRTCMVTGDGLLYVDSTYVFGMAVAAAKNIKKGKGSIQALVASTLQVDDERIILSNRSIPEGGPTRDSSQPVYVDVRGVVNPSTKGRNVRYRLAANIGWACAFTINWDKTVVGRDLMHAVFVDASKLVGLGNGRKIGYGRFTLDSFLVHDAKTSAAA